MKKTSADQHKSSRMVRLPEDLHDAMLQLKEEEGVPVTQQTRRALEAWLAQRGKWPPAGETTPATVE